MKFKTECKNKAASVINTGTVGGHEYTLTDEYLMKDGKPYIYTMGELHFSRMKEEDWEPELRKMKSGGIDIVSSYLFWNHHEYEPGTFDFSGRRNIRKFIDICEKLDMPFFLRLGPWVHGEARLGGFPDWLKEKCGRTRSLDPDYLFYVERYYREIYNQVGTSGNILGIQIENEYSGGPDYLQRLYDMAKNIGFDALFFTGTGWDDAVLPDCLVPVFGAYPEYPWAQHTDVFRSGRTYGFFEHDCDAYLKRAGKERKYPVFTCELGGGNQSTYHRRPLIQPREVASLTLAQLGTGCRGLGYYMYHGGVNPVVCGENGSIISTFQESRETGYGNDCPVVSYDFQSPLGDCGQYRQSYFELKTLLDFVKCETDSLVRMQPFSDENMPDFQDMKPLRAAVLSDGESGFLFYINTYHGHKLPAKNETAEIVLKNETLEIPLAVPADSCGIVPFNFRVGSELLSWVKAFPVGITADSVTFSVSDGVSPDFMTADGKRGNLKNVRSIGGVKIILTRTQHPVPDKGEALTVTETEKKLPFDIFGHIIPKKNTRLPDLTKEYSVQVPDGVSFVSVSAVGNLGAAFAELPGGGFRLVSDRFLDGDEWIVDVRGVKTLILKIQPLREEDRKTVYLEKLFATGYFTPSVYACTDKILVKNPENDIICITENN